jgi:hypothetical protein
MLVEVPSPDLRNRKTPQANDAASVGGAPVPTGILGRLWRVPVLGLALKESLSCAVMRKPEANPRKAASWLRREIRRTRR